MSSPKKTMVVVADAEPASRYGLVVLFNAEARLRVVGETMTVSATREICAAKRPDVLLIDPGMEGGGGWTLLGDLPRWSKGTQALVFARAADPVAVKRALDAEARGVATRLDTEADLLKVLLGLKDGKVHLSPRVLEALGEGLVNGRVAVAQDTRARLSEREREVFALLGEGQRTSILADRLRVSVKTVESHYERLKEKLAVRSMAELRQAAAVAARE